MTEILQENDLDIYTFIFLSDTYMSLFKASVY